MRSSFVMLLEDVKRQTEKLTGIARPTAHQAQALVRERKANAYRFHDDGVTPNNPEWPLIHYRGVARLDATLIRPPFSKCCSTAMAGATAGRDL